MEKLRPCDCKDMLTASKLEEQGISINENSLTLHPNYVELTRGHTTMKIPMGLFKKFAEWYLTEQELK